MFQSGKHHAICTRVPDVLVDFLRVKILRFSPNRNNSQHSTGNYNNSNWKSQNLAFYSCFTSGPLSLQPSSFYNKEPVPFLKAEVM